MMRGAKRTTDGVGRRTALQLAAGGLCVGLTPGALQAQTDATRERPKEGDLLVPVGATAPTPLTLDDLTVGAKPVIAWPMEQPSGTVRSGSRLNRVLVLRLDPDGFDDATKARAADG